MPAKFFSPNADLQLILERILEDTWEAFPELAQNQVAATWIVYEPPVQVNTGGAIAADTFWQYQPSGASYRGVELIEPGALVQLFYLVAMHVWLEQDMAQLSPEIARAIADMTTTNSNDATSFIVDVLSGTTSGPTIPAGPFETWQSQRNIVNRYFQQLGWPELRAVNLNQKTWSQGPYGRERAFFGNAFDNRNQLTTEAVARLIHSIIGGVSVSAKRSQAMMDLLKRTTEQNTSIEPEASNTIAREDAIGSILPVGTKIWSKFSKHHAAAYIEAADDTASHEATYPYQLVVFTAAPEKVDSQEIISFISQQVFQSTQQLVLASSKPKKAETTAKTTAEKKAEKKTAKSQSAKSKPAKSNSAKAAAKAAAKKETTKSTTKRKRATKGD